MAIPTSELVYPMVALFCWTFLVMLRNVQVRVFAVLRGELTNEYFELFAGAEPSKTIVKTGNHLRNLFEFPILFYAATISIIVTGGSDSAFLILAWVYVGLRIGHTLVHLTVNKVPPRFLFYILSNIVLLALWLRLAIQL
jgi:hypothetical protein